eukprot:14956091-Alexandrium_andersonii.AAC.1
MSCCPSDGVPLGPSEVDLPTTRRAHVFKLFVLVRSARRPRWRNDLHPVWRSIEDSQLHLVPGGLRGS